MNGFGIKVFVYRNIRTDWSVTTLIFIRILTSIDNKISENMTTGGGWGIQIKTNLIQELEVWRDPDLRQIGILQCQKGFICYISEPNTR